MEITQTKNFVDANGNAIIYKQNAHLHGLVQCGNVELHKLYGLKYYYINNGSHIYQAKMLFGTKRYRRHTLTFIKTYLFFKKQDLLTRGLEISSNNNEFDGNKLKNRCNSPILRDEQFDYVTNGEMYIRTHNVFKYGLVKFIGKNAANFFGLRYFYLQSKGNSLKRSTRLFRLRAGCEETTYYFYKKDIQALKIDLQSNNDTASKIQPEPVKEVNWAMMSSRPLPPPAIERTKDTLADLIDCLRQAEAKVVQIKELIKKELSL